MSAPASPFSRRTAMLLVAAGALAFLLLLWLIGRGIADGERNNGQAHAASKGLAGYAAMAAYLGKRGYQVDLVEARGQLRQGGLLVLTPPAVTDIKELNQVVEARRRIGPTLVITPKWIAVPQLGFEKNGKPGWVRLVEAGAPNWPGFHDEITLYLEPMDKGTHPGGWSSIGVAGTLARTDKVMSGKGKGLVPLVWGDSDARALVSYVGDGDYPALRAIALGDAPEHDPDQPELDVPALRPLYPVVFVFEPDLVNNLGFNRPEAARLTDLLVGALTRHGSPKRVSFDLTFNGFVQADNLLTLAFTPPFLAATLCLMLAALAVFWRAFNRFGPPLSTGPAIAFGKRALVTNAAGLVQRARRLHLIGAPYADAARDRLARALALPHRLDGAATEAAIDRALERRAPGSTPFSAAAAAMRAARRPVPLLRAAQTLHSLERILTK